MVRFGLFRVRSPLLAESRLISSPPGTEMFHFPGSSLPGLFDSAGDSRLAAEGFPHSDISGSEPACGSPKLFAACHVLLRLSAPRHPSRALSILTTKQYIDKTNVLPANSRQHTLRRILHVNSPSCAIVKELVCRPPPGKTLKRFRGGHRFLRRRLPRKRRRRKWWACLDSNQGPRPYQGRALTG